MKLLWTAFAIAVGLSACTQKGSSSLEELSSKIENAVRNNQSEQIVDAIYLEGADPEVRKVMTEIMKLMVFSEMSQIKIETRAFADYQPEMDLPGYIHGRSLKWLKKPSHWIIVKASNKDETGNGASLNLDMAAGQVKGKWYLIGPTYAGEATAKVSLPGLTDRNATAIAYNKDGEVLDFVTITPDSDMEEIVFKAPENGDKISVTVVGPSRNQEITENLVISSSNEEGMRGSVSVYVENGVVTGIFGNGISQGSLLDEFDLKDVLEKIQSGSHEPSERVEIIRK